MDKHEYINFLINLNLKGINKDSSDEETYFDFIEMGIKEAYQGFNREECLFISAFLKLYPHIYYVELLRRVFGVEIWKRQENYMEQVKRINWEYHKYFFHQYVGPFFYINNQIVGLKMDITATNAYYSKFINHPKSHFDFFNESLSYLEDDYGNYPRGRVVYNNANNEFIIYVDKSLFDKKEIINSIKKYYNLTSDNVVIKKDEHYTHDFLK